MNRRSVLAVGATALAGCSDALSGPDAREAETLIAEGVTDLRAQESLPALASESTLQTAARDHCADMAARDFYAHESPDGAEPSDRAGCAAGEVIHRGEIGKMRNAGSDQTYQTALTEELAAFVVDGWARSEAHRETLLSPRWSAMGVGVWIDDDEFFAACLVC